MVEMVETDYLESQPVAGACASMAKLCEVAGAIGDYRTDPFSSY